MYKWATEQCFIFRLASHHGLILPCTFSVFWIKHSLSILPYYSTDQPRSHPTPYCCGSEPFKVLFTNVCEPNLSLYTYECKSTSLTWSIQGLHSNHVTTKSVEPHRSRSDPILQAKTLTLSVSDPRPFLFYLCVTLLCLRLCNATIMSINLAKSPRLQGCGLPFPVPDQDALCHVLSGLSSFFCWNQ